VCAYFKDENTFLSFLPLDIFKIIFRLINTENESQKVYQSYIHKILKMVHPDTCISKEAVNYVNDILLKIFSSLTDMLKGNYTNDRLYESLLVKFLSEQLAKHAKNKGINAITKYSEYSDEYKNHSKNFKAGLTLSISKTKNLIKSKKVDEYLVIYLTSTLEYLTEEIMELAGNCARDFKKKTIQVFHINFAIQNDEELLELMKRI
jgi:histone H3/H4